MMKEEAKYRILGCATKVKFGDSRAAEMKKAAKVEG